jgi:hypothetical protein
LSAGGQSSEEADGWGDEEGEGFEALEEDPREAEAAERLRRLNTRSGGGAARTGARGGGAAGSSGMARQASLDSDTSLASGFSQTSSHLTSGAPPPLWCALCHHSV